MIVSLNSIEIDPTGLAVIAGKGAPVGKLLMDKWAYGMDAETLVKKWPQLSLAEVHAALAYYYSHQEEVDGQIERIDREETIAGVKRGLADAEAGRVRSLEEFDRYMREKNDIAP